MITRTQGDERRNEREEETNEKNNKEMRLIYITCMHTCNVNNDDSSFVG